MKAISIKNPWANLECVGIKDIENRTWPTSCRERVLIHSSGKCVTKKELDLLLNDKTRLLFEENNFDYNAIKGLRTSAIIGSVEIIDCVTNHKSIWAQHEAFNWHCDKDGNLIKNTTYNWILANPILFDQPINAKGTLSFWESSYEEIICPNCGQIQFCILKKCITNSLQIRYSK